MHSAVRQTGHPSTPSTSIELKNAVSLPCWHFFSISTTATNYFLKHLFFLSFFLHISFSFISLSLLNPFTAMPAALSLVKTMNKSAKLEIIKDSPPPPLPWAHMKGLLSRCTVPKVDLLKDYQIYCLQAWALFSSDISQAGAVKGLTYI